MTNADESRGAAEFSDEELRAQEAEALPNREQMSVLNPDIQPLPPVLLADGPADVNPT